MKKGFALLTLIFVLITAGCDQDTLLNGKTTITNINDTKELRIGVDPSIPIYSYVDKSGSLVGYDIDVMEEVAKRLGYKTKYYYSNSDSLFAGLSSKRFDITTGHIAITNDLQKKYDFSNPYKTTQTVIMRKDNGEKWPDTIINVNNLKEASITLPLTSVYATLAHKYKMKVQQGGNFENGMMDLENGKSKYMIYDKDVIEHYLAVKQISDLRIGYTFPEEQPIGLMLRKGNTSLVQSINKKLNEMKNDGTMNKIEKKWFTEGNISKS